MVLTVKTQITASLDRVKMRELVSMTSVGTHVNAWMDIQETSARTT